MYKKNNNFRTGLIIALLIATTVLSVGWYTSQPRSRAVAGNADNTRPILEQQVPSSNIEAQPPVDVRTKTINGITVELISAKVIETGIEVVICYTTPDSGDWYTTPGALSYSTYEIFADEAEFISEQKADGKKTGERCEAIRYRIDEPESITMPIQFSALGFWAVPKELPPCENLQQRLDTNPKAKTYGLKMNCSYDDQTGISVTLSEKLPSVAQSKAQQVLDEIVRGEIFGPWEFTITELEK